MSNEFLRPRRLDRRGRSEFVMGCENELGIVVSLSDTQRVSLRLDGRLHTDPARIRSVTIMPPGHRGHLKVDGPGSVLIAQVPIASLSAWLAEDHEADSGKVEFQPRFHVEDQAIARLMFHATRGDPEAAGRAIAARLLWDHSGRSRRPGSAKGGLSQAGLRRTLDFVEAGLRDPLPIARLAAEAGISPFHFVREFKRMVGLSPHRHILNRRIERAIALLARRDRTISDIAHEAGFANRSHLARHMRSQTGFSPEGFRRDVLFYPVLSDHSDR